MSDKFETTGKVYLISPTETRGNFTFRKFVLEIADNPKYPQFVEFQTTRDNIGKLDTIKVGDEVRVEFNLRGREWTSKTGEVKYFNTLDAWKIDAKQVAAQPPQHQASLPHPNSPGTDSIPDDDLPF